MRLVVFDLAPGGSVRDISVNSRDSDAWRRWGLDLDYIPMSGYIESLHPRRVRSEHVVRAVESAIRCALADPQTSRHLEALDGLVTFGEIASAAAADGVWVQAGLQSAPLPAPLPSLIAQERHITRRRGSYKPRQRGRDHDCA